MDGLVLNGAGFCGMCVWHGTENAAMLCDAGCVRRGGEAEAGGVWEMEIRGKRRSECLFRTGLWGGAVDANPCMPGENEEDRLERTQLLPN